MIDRKRRLFSAVLAVALLLQCAACGVSRTESGTTNSAASTAGEPSTTAAVSEALTALASNTAASEKETAKETQAKPSTVRSSEKESSSEATQATTAQAQTQGKDELFAWAGGLKDRLTTAPSKQGERFFDDAIFVGDSVTLGLKNYVTKERNNGKSCLGKAQFLCGSSIGYGNSLMKLDADGNVHPKYNGKKVLVQDGIQQSGAKKAFLMMGMNDFCVYSLEASENNAEKLIGKILEKSPDIEIYIESVTPILSGKEHGKFTNENIDKFNEMLKRMCAENGWTYVDIASVFKDENGCLKKSCCGDSESMGIHMSYTACSEWIKYLVSIF